ncbi:PEGA domain-containing protein [Myxococcota bacterium]
MTGVFFLLFVGCQSGSATIVRSVPPDSLALRVDCQPDEAEVRVDGVFQGTCQLLSRAKTAMKLAAGTHELEVAADGYRSFRSVVSGKGIQESLTVRLTPRTAE